MILEVNENLLEFPLQGIIHQANCFHVMGGGIAKRIRDKYPEAYSTDVNSGTRGDSKRLGTFSVTQLTSDGKYIYNLYGQFNYGHMARFTSYDAVCNGLGKIEKDAQAKELKTLGLPKNMGCVLGGGAWGIVKSIIDEIFAQSSIELYICNYEG